MISVFIPDSVTIIGANAFFGCRSLESVSIPNSLTSIAFSAFSHCSSLKSVFIPNSVTTIDGVAFEDCINLTSVTIPNSVTTIGAQAFSGCSNLTSVTIPNSVIDIDFSAFDGCSGLISIAIGSGIQRIGNRAFASCKNVSEVYCYAKNVPSVSTKAFEDSFIEYSTLYVPSVSVDSYKRFAPWNEFKNITSIEEGKIYNLTISAFGGGSVSYNGTNILEGQREFIVNEGNTAVLLTFVPNSGYLVGSVKVDGVDVTSSVSNNQYTISNISKNTTVNVTFEMKSGTILAYEGIYYSVLSGADKTVNVANGEYAQSLEVPASIIVNGVSWSVKGIESSAMESIERLVAVIWNPTVRFNVSVSNPNFLLYVTSADYAPSNIKNVIVNGTANSISLTEADSDNDFYCPQAFAARSINYSHNYGMTTGVGECRGWETIALPFDVQKIAHAEKGQIIPFALWQSGETRRPFWLYELTSNGWKEAGTIKANTPYIISMPNNELYHEASCLNGRVTFSAENVTVRASGNNTPSYNGKTFVPNFSTRESNSHIYALNVNNDWTTYNGNLAEGSHFVQNLRTVHPFEAYMIVTGNNARPLFGIFDDDATEVRGIKILLNQRKGTYNLNGQKLDESTDRKLPAGVYIIDGQKVMVK